LLVLYKKFVFRIIQSSYFEQQGDTKHYFKPKFVKDNKYELYTKQ
jgi:hypothetical protein